MKKLYLSLITASLVCLFTDARSQNDSSWLDAGNLKFKKQFTQTISIKGEDLEKMFFTNLADAINVWLYGVYSNPGTLIYVVDGIPLGDVNGYNIHDIDEVIFIQNALVQLNGVSGQQQLVLIRTKRKGRGGTGLTLAGQAGLVNKDLREEYPGKNLRSNTDLYEQYYAGLNRSATGVDYGISADYLRDVLPSIRKDSINTITPFNMQRYRLNGYFDIRLGKRNDLSVHVSYTDQKMDSAQHFFLVNNPGLPANQTTHQRQTEFIPWLRLHSRLGKGWENDLESAWLISTNKVADELDNTDSFRNPVTISTFGSPYHHTEHFFVRDHISYTAQAGGWNIVPSLNASYEHIQDLDTTSVVEKGDNHLLSETFSTYGSGPKIWFLSPSIDISYKNVLDIQAGVMINLTKDLFQYPGVSKAFPFASLCIDLLKWHDPESKTALKLFGSVAKAPNWNTQDFALSDPARGNGILYGPPGLIGGANYTNTTGTYYGNIDFQGIFSNPAGTPYWGRSAGVVFATAGNRLEVNYNFEERDCAVQPYLILGYPIFDFTHPMAELTYSLHHFGVTIKLLTGKDLNWQTGLNATTISSNTVAFGNPVGVYGIEGNQRPDHPDWTGGWVNQLSFHNLSCGVNIVYHLNGLLYNPGVNFVRNVQKTNSILLQNVYLAYRLRMAGQKSLELYLDGRDLFRTDPSGPTDLSDGRRYYGVGGKLSI